MGLCTFRGTRTGISEGTSPWMTYNSKFRATFLSWTSPWAAHWNAGATARCSGPACGAAYCQVHNKEQPASRGRARVTWCCPDDAGVPVLHHRQGFWGRCCSVIGAEVEPSHQGRSFLFDWSPQNNSALGLGTRSVSFSWDSSLESPALPQEHLGKYKWFGVFCVSPCCGITDQHQSLLCRKEHGGRWA